MNNSEAARQLGKVRSEAKSAAARENGKLGGRPRKIRLGGVVENYHGPDLNGGARVLAVRADRVRVGGSSRWPRVPGARLGRDGEHQTVGYWIPKSALEFVSTLKTDRPDAHEFQVWRIKG